MTTMEWAVLVGGLAGIIWINWYFFLAARPGARATLGPSGTQEITIAVQGGYEPAVVYAKKDVRVRLTFDRRERSGCSEEVVIPDFGVRTFLPAFQQTTIEIHPTKPGPVEFSCGMGMLRGRLIVQD